ncbi:uncharacterized protein N7496_009619 [Penicillium cataractarum]|uniref:Uncharacterized protein n=1 Tax=Penicillium cataractarum TaxID=2100454 RepID=A0A9W9RPV3_9EURO|nr:uncharacterized protein N7496_009619 [Penicillium cataractarum]KAJ5363906.1 hypothetical protein N7496_009619 [Penicillium cataractarum]
MSEWLYLRVWKSQLHHSPRKTENSPLQRLTDILILSWKFKPIAQAGFSRTTEMSMNSRLEKPAQASDQPHVTFLLPLQK